MRVKGVLLGLKISRICREVTKLVSAYGIESSVTFYGAYWINPKNFVCWVIVDSDEEKAKLENETSLLEDFRRLLDIYRYPEPARQFCHFGFESNERVKRDFHGNWYHRFQSK